MKLLEHEAKNLLSAAGIVTPLGEVVSSDSRPSIPFPLVLKSQVPTGGRGKLGGVRIIKTQPEFELAKASLFELPIKSFLPKVLLAEERLDIAQEVYLGVLIDRHLQGITLMAHTKGGVEVENNTDFKTWNLDYDSFDVDTIGQELADYYNLPSQTFALQDLIENLLKCFKQNDATLIEINPLILTTDDQLVAGDCKMTLDDAAAFRHDWHFEDTPAEANFVTIDPTGNIATIANGAGLAMATVDAVYEAGLRPANFLDIGGGANTQTLLTAFHELMKYPSVKAIVINIFAGITRADEVARAIVAAKKEIADLPPLFIRLAGTNDHVATAILSGENITILPSLEACLSAAAREVTHG